MPEQRYADVVVLGGGPAGLAAAWRTAETGRSVVLLERAPTLGGMAASFEVAGVRVDHGSHRLHPATEPDLLDDLRRLLGDDLQTRPRHGRLAVYGTWVGFPLQIGELLRAVPRSAAARIAKDAALSPLRRRSDASYGAALRSSLGAEIYGELYEPFARKLWGVDGTHIDVEQGRRRVSADTPWRVLRRMLANRRGEQQGRVFHYPRRGFGQIVEALATAALTAGAEIRTGAEVISVDTRSGRPVVTTADGESVVAGRVFSTVPLPVLARLVRPAPSQQVLTDAAALRFRAMLLVYLVHPGGRWTEYDAHYLPGDDTSVSRISEPANYRESSDDPADRSVICAEIPCDVGDELWESSDAVLAHRVSIVVDRYGLPPLPTDGAVVRRMPHVYPVYVRGYAPAFERVDAWADSLPRITTFGRLGLFAHDNTHHALAMARDAVASLTDEGGWDDAAWTAARERFTKHVVED